MLPSFPEIAKCVHCHAIYWTEDAKVLGDLENGSFSDKDRRDPPKEWWRARLIEFLTIEEYVEALDSGIAENAGQEKFLRLHLWWAVNDTVRWKKKREVSSRYTTILEENWKRLRLLLDVTKPDEKLMLAEIAREQGQFEVALEMSGDLPQEYRWFAYQIFALAMQGDARVRRIEKRDTRKGLRLQSFPEHGKQ